MFKLTEISSIYILSVIYHTVFSNMIPQNEINKLKKCFFNVSIQFMQQKSFSFYFGINILDLKKELVKSPAIK